MLIHASSVALDHRAVLLTGLSGSGKSDLALRLIDEGARLVSDDQTLLTRTDNQLIASAPDSIQGLIEVRHVGLLRVPFIAAASAVLYIDLVDSNTTLERLPEKEFITLLEVTIRRVQLSSFAASTPAKIRALLNYLDAT